MAVHALVVDDSGMWRDLFVRAVERSGLRPESASTTLRALELVRRHSYSLVLLDADLGTEQGVRGCSEIVAELKARNIEVPVIIASGVQGLEDLVNDLRRYYRSIKPFSKTRSMMELEDLIRETVGTLSESTTRSSLTLDDLVPYVECGFAFMKLDIVRHSAIYLHDRTYDIDETLEAFEDFVEREVMNYQGEIFSWQGDGGLAAFFTGDKATNCVGAALSILYSLNRFTDSTKNKLGSDIKVRVACHIGTAKYKTNRGRIHSAAINFVCHLEAAGTSENAICVSAPLYAELPEKTQGRFTPKESFNNVMIYEHRLQS